MPNFYYKARDRNGSPNEGVVDATDDFTAKRLLSERGLFVLSVAEGQPAGADFTASWDRFRNRLFGQISLEERIVFNRQLQTSYSVGVSLVQALRMIADQTQTDRFRRVILDIIEQLVDGRSLHESMARHPHVFDPIYLNAVKAGESSGKLDEILNLLCYFAEQEMENRAKIKSATLYPKIILFTMGVVIVVITTFVMPKMQEFYGKMGGQLPGITLAVMGFASFIRNYWFLLIAGAFGGYFLFQRWVSTERGRYAWDKFKLKVPVFGSILLQYEVLMFSTVLTLLLKSGLPILEALRLVRDSISNAVIRKEIEDCRAAVESGRDISHGFQASKVFPKIVGNLISVAEESGRVDDVLEKVGSYYRVQLEYRLNNLSKTIEPIFLALIFGVVLILVLAVFLPIWKMSQLMRNR